MGPDRDPDGAGRIPAEEGDDGAIDDTYRHHGEVGVAAPAPAARPLPALEAILHYWRLMQNTTSARTRKPVIIGKRAPIQHGFLLAVLAIARNLQK